MKTSKITLPFTRLSDGAVEDLALAISAAITGNAHFPEPTPSLATLTDITKRFSEALALAQTRDKVKVAIKNNLRQELQVTLTNLASYCSYIAKGDRAIQASSGFSLNAEMSTAKTLSAPENFTVQLGNNSGEVILYVNNAPNAKAYLFLYGLSPIVNNAWLHATNSLPYFTIAGLVPGSTYSFKIAAIGSKGQALYTAVITKMIV